MNYRVNRSWPPDWLWTVGYDTTHPRGEVGILKAISRSVPPEDVSWSWTTAEQNTSVRYC